MDGYFTTKQFAEKIGRTQSRVIQLIRSGELMAEKAGNTYLISKKDAESFKLKPITGRPKSI